MASVSARHFRHQRMYHNINSMGTITRAMSCSSRLVLIQDLREINQRINRASVWRWSHGRVIAKASSASDRVPVGSLSVDHYYQTSLSVSQSQGK